MDVLVLRFLRWIFVLISAFALNPVFADEQRSPASGSPKDYAIAKMKLSALSPEFIQLVVDSYDESSRDKVIELNTLGFVSKADYSGHLSKRAIRKCREFLYKYRRTLRRAKRRYHVDPEVIASLLWVETKHGEVMGSYAVPSVFFSLLQADHPEVLAHTMKALDLKIAAPTPEDIAKVKERSRAKGEWALEELKALETMALHKLKRARVIKGSFAGAFGMPQFLPSSYGKWARSFRKARARPDLFRADDAIYSVASYLHSNGWKPKSPDAQRGALFHYNRSQGYVDVILQIAQCIKDEGRASGSRKIAATREHVSCSG